MALTTTREYRSTDAGAPVLDGTPGSGAALVERLLNGNGSGIAYGSKPAAGWSKVFGGTNKVALRNSMAAGGTGYCFRLDDTGTVGAGGAREMMLRAYSSMSDIDTGGGPMPTVAQWANGVPLRKSNTLDSTPRAWIAGADELTFWIYIEHSATSRSIYGFGDFEDYVPGSSYRAFVAGGYVENNASNCALTHFGVANFASATVAGGRGLYVARGYSLIGDPAAFSIPTLTQSTTASQPPANVNIGAGGSTAPMQSPSAGTGINVYIPSFVGAEGIIRGRLRGLYSPLNNLSAVASGTYETAPAGVPSGSKLAILRTSGVAGSDGALAIETALEW